jgi:hypothetical protein
MFFDTDRNEFEYRRSVQIADKGALTFQMMGCGYAAFLLKRPKSRLFQD